MNKILTAVALSIAIPAVANAQSSPAPATRTDCCEKMKAEGKDCCCCKDMAGNDHASHDMHGADGSKPQADQHKH